MTPEVKKRIEQIRQGIVPEGYVKDKDGIYPRDWASKKIGQWLKLAERSIVLQDEEAYRLVTVRRGFGGVDSRGSFLGKNVLVKNYFIVKTGDFIISKRQIAHGACGIVPPELDGAVVSNEYNVFLPQDGTNIQMFNLMMQLPHYKRLFYLMSDGVHIEKLLFKTQDWMKRTLAMPLLKEQKRIAEILATQDKAIELQGRKIEELKRFKQGCLERMFPRKGQKVPEKRFPGFTDDWEQRKLGELGSLKNGMNFSKEAMGIGFPFVNLQNIFGNNVIDVTNLGKAMASDSQLKDYNLLNGDVLFVRSSVKLQGVGEAALVPQNLENTTYSGFIIRFRDEYGLDNNFKRFLFGIESVRNQIMAQATNSANKNISQTVLENLCLKIPNKSEQENIGLYFSNLDKLITLHQRKLEEMKRQKKALMQLLLTGIVKTKGEVR